MAAIVIATSSQQSRFCFLFMLRVSLLRISLSHHCRQEQTPRAVLPSFPVFFHTFWSNEHQTLVNISGRCSDFLVSCSISLFESPFWCLKILVETGDAVAISYWCIPEDLWISLIVTSITPLLWFIICLSNRDLGCILSIWQMADAQRTLVESINE